MGRKLMAMVGFGAGIALVRKEMKENPSGPVAKTVTAVTTNPTVVATTQSAKNKATQIIQEQGERLTDKIADMIKERLFGVPVQQSTPKTAASNGPVTGSNSKVTVIEEPTDPSKSGPAAPGTTNSGFGG